MTKIIAVTGATGVQGGSVAREFLKNPEWKVRAITRNPNSDAAKAFSAQGAEVVQADYNDEDSVVAAFKGVHAIFAVTNFWEHLFTGKTPDESGEIEQRQSTVLAKAAAKTPTLEHYIWSTLPSASDLTGGKCPVPHLDYKAKVDQVIRAELPDLAAKTTFLWFGFYPANMAFFPMMKPFEVPGSYGKYIFLAPIKPTTTIPTAGDMNVTPGIWVRQIVGNPQKSHGKYAVVNTEVLTFEKILQNWSAVSGKPAVFVETSMDAYEKLWGVGGKELAQQLQFGEQVPDWTSALGDSFVGMEDLGISVEEAKDFKGALEVVKAHLT